MLFVGVDAGRFGIKIMASKDGKKIERDFFESKYTSVNFKKLKHHPVLDFRKDRDILVQVDGKSPIGYGNICSKIAPPGEIQYVSTDDIYLEKSIDYTIVAIAKMVKEKNEDVVIGIALTEENIDKGEEIVIPALEGKHEVKFFDPNGNELETKIFTIKKTGAWHQCWLGFMSYVIKNDSSIDKEWAAGEYIGIDVGRRTAIGCYIYQMSPVENKAFEYGAEKYFKYIQEELKVHYQIKKSTHEIEKIISKNKSPVKDGKPIDMKKIKIEAMKRYEDGLRNCIKEHFDGYHPDKYVFMGGGSILFGDVLKQMYPEAIVLEDPTFRNAEGLVKFLVRKFARKKKGVE